MPQRTRIVGAGPGRGTALRLARSAMLTAAPLVARTIRRDGAAELIRRVGGRLVELPGERHPLAPAAVRVERSRSIRRGRQADQVAVTVWFRDGPSLPVPGGAGTGRTALRVGASLLGAVAVAAAGAAAARITAEEPERLGMDPEPRRLGPPGG